MRAYLDAMDQAAAADRAVKPAAPPPRVLAALGPKMLDLSAERADGAHTYLVTPEHTAKARAQLGPAPWLAVEQAVVLESDPAAARAIGRRHLGSLPRPAQLHQLHQQPPPPRLHERGHRGPWQRPPGRRPRRLGEASTPSPCGSTIISRPALIRSACRSSTLILTACRFDSGGRSPASSCPSSNRQIRSLVLYVDLVGSSRIWPAHVGCPVDLVGSSRSRRIVWMING
jgi:hypothetical protein